MREDMGRPGLRTLNADGTISLRPRPSVNGHDHSGDAAWLAGVMDGPDDGDTAEQDDANAAAIVRERARRHARNVLDAEERASAGDRSLFVPVDLLTVEEPPPLELGPEGIWPLRALALMAGSFNIGKTPLLVYTALRRIRAGWMPASASGCMSRKWARPVSGGRRASSAAESARSGASSTTARPVTVREPDRARPSPSPACLG